MPEKKLVLITGGARSGKSTYAEELVQEFGENIVYLATAVATDGEMTRRIKDHQAARPSQWKTVEESLNVADALGKLPPETEAVLIDCITFWVSNQLMNKSGMEEPGGEKVKEIEMAIVEKARKLCESLNNMGCSVIMVSNEVGLGLVPEGSLSRIYRDALGRVNQMLAREVHQVIFMVSGIPLKVKG